MDIKVGDVVNPRKVGQRGFNHKELFQTLIKLQTVWCWGPQAWTYYQDKFLRFKSNGFLHKGHVYITLGWDDTFTIIYTTMKGRVLCIDKGVYIDQLVGSIDNRVEQGQGVPA